MRVVPCNTSPRPTSPFAPSTTPPGLSMPTPPCSIHRAPPGHLCPRSHLPSLHPPHPPGPSMPTLTPHPSHHPPHPRAIHAHAHTSHHPPRPLGRLCPCSHLTPHTIHHAPRPSMPTLAPRVAPFVPSTPAFTPHAPLSLCWHPSHLHPLHHPHSRPGHSHPQRPRPLVHHPHPGLNSSVMWLHVVEAKETCCVGGDLPLSLPLSFTVTFSFPFMFSNPSR